MGARRQPILGGMGASGLGNPVSDLEGEQDLFEMANLYPRTTGLPVTVWASPKGRARHDTRIKVCMTPGDRMDAENTAVVAIRPHPALIRGELPTDTLGLVLRWAALNGPALVDYWNGVTDTVEFVGRLQRV